MTITLNKITWVIGALFIIQAVLIVLNILPVWTFTGGLGTFIGWTIFVFYRLNWTMKARIKASHAGMTELVDFEEMAGRVWCWDIFEFRKDKNKLSKGGNREDTIRVLKAYNLM